MRRTLARFAAVMGLAALAAAPVQAEEEDAQPVIQDVLEILKERGLVDEGQYNELVAKNQVYEEKQEGLLGHIKFSGDLRLRYENFWYDDDELGDDRSNRNRLRYRLRLQAQAEINEWMDAVLRLASGENDPRSTNRTLGFGNDFDPDAIFIDQAYLVVRAPESWVGDSTLVGTGGKVPNPFLWKAARWDALWDADINPEGLAVDFGWAPGEDLKLFSKAGYFIVDENGTNADPHVLGVQAGLVWAASELVELGARGTWYSWGSLNRDFLGRAANSGTIEDGLTGEPGEGSGTMDVFELAAYLKFGGLDGWPVTVFGQVGKNLDADGSDLFPGLEDEDLGWLVGFEVGDRKKLLALGVTYAYFEANFWPAQFTESDLFDGFTNRKGWGIYGSKEVLPNTELTVTLYVSDEIRDHTPGFETSIANANRLRLQTDLQVKF
jgi:hypothetical protein